MSITFTKAPLVEIIAELRWGLQPDPTFLVQQPPNAPPIMAINPSKLDEFFMRFGGEVYQQGFQRAERIVPPGFPMVLHQPVFRYRKSSGPNSSALYQTGPGLFSANAIPPYHSWDEFAPVVQSGIEALLKSRHDAEKSVPFTSIHLRYIDVFGPELTKGHDVQSFIRDVLGLAVNLPPGVANIIAPGQNIKAHYQLSVPLSNNMNMNLVVGEGNVNNETVVVMDTTISTSGEVAADSKSAMEVLHSAQIVIHQMFLDLTQPIHALMQPAKG